HVEHEGRSELLRGRGPGQPQDGGQRDGGQHELGDGGSEPLCHVEPPRLCRSALATLVASDPRSLRRPDHTHPHGVSLALPAEGPRGLPVPTDGTAPGGDEGVLLCCKAVGAPAKPRCAARFESTWRAPSGSRRPAATSTPASSFPRCGISATTCWIRGAS